MSTIIINGIDSLCAKEILSCCGLFLPFRGLCGLVGVGGVGLLCSGSLTIRLIKSVFDGFQIVPSVSITEREREKAREKERERERESAETTRETEREERETDRERDRTSRRAR